MNRLMTATFATLLLCFAFGAQGQASAQAQPQAANQTPPQAPAGSRPAPAPLAIPNPHYVSIAMEIDVDRPASEVWKRVGKFCDIGEWFQVPCTILSGTDGEVGVVRSIGNEVMVGKTELSYTYTQPVREGQPYTLYHGTLEARPVTATTSKLVYTLLFDNSMLADDAARDADVARRRTLFMNGLKNMKILAEGGTLPPRPAPAPGSR
jgi:Polyketide cyclase / dehydrase and lipid transport